MRTEITTSNGIVVADDGARIIRVYRNGFDFRIPANNLRIGDLVHLNVNEHQPLKQMVAVTKIRKT